MQNVICLKSAPYPDHSLKLTFTTKYIDLKILSETVKTLIMFRETVSFLFKDKSLPKDHNGPKDR